MYVVYVCLLYRVSQKNYTLFKWLLNKKYMTLGDKNDMYGTFMISSFI